MAQTFEYDGLKYEIANPDAHYFFEEVNRPSWSPGLWVILLGQYTPTRIVVWADFDGRHLEDAIEVAAAYAVEQEYFGLVLPHDHPRMAELHQEAEAELRAEGVIGDDTDPEEAQLAIGERAEVDTHYTESGQVDDWNYIEHQGADDPFVIAAALNTIEAISQDEVTLIANAREASVTPEAAEAMAYQEWCAEVLDGGDEWWHVPYCIVAPEDRARPGAWHVIVINAQIPDDAELGLDEFLDGWWIYDDVDDLLTIFVLPTPGSMVGFPGLSNMLVLQDYALSQGWYWSVARIWPPIPGYNVVRDETERVGYLRPNPEAVKARLLAW